MSNVDVLTSSDAVKRKNGRSAEDEFTMVPEIILGTTLVEKNGNYKMAKPYSGFRYLYIMYGQLESLSCMQTMLVAVRFINGKKNQFLLHTELSTTSSAIAQIGFTNETTIEVQTASAKGEYPNMYLKVCGIR